MDLMTLIGVFIGGGSIIYVMAHGGILHFLFNGEAIVLLQDGLDLETVKSRLEKDISTTRARRQQLIDVFRSAGTYSPIFGLLGTLVGVVQVLRNITNLAAMGASMAVAMTASFYGIF